MLQSEKFEAFNSTNSVNLKVDLKFNPGQIKRSILQITYFQNIAKYTAIIRQQDFAQDFLFVMSNLKGLFKYLYSIHEQKKFELCEIIEDKIKISYLLNLPMGQKTIVQTFNARRQNDEFLRKSQLEERIQQVKKQSKTQFQKIQKQKNQIANCIYQILQEVHTERQNSQNKIKQMEQKHSDDIKQIKSHMLKLLKKFDTLEKQPSQVEQKLPTKALRTSTRKIQQNRNAQIKDISQKNQNKLNSKTKIISKDFVPKRIYKSRSRLSDQKPLIKDDYIVKQVVQTQELQRKKARQGDLKQKLNMRKGIADLLDSVVQRQYSNSSIILDERDQLKQISENSHSSSEDHQKFKSKLDTIIQEDINDNLEDYLDDNFEDKNRYIKAMKIEQKKQMNLSKSRHKKKQVNQIIDTQCIIVSESPVKQQVITPDQRRFLFNINQLLTGLNKQNGINMAIQDENKFIPQKAEFLNGVQKLKKLRFDKIAKGCRSFIDDFSFYKTTIGKFSDKYPNSYASLISYSSVPHVGRFYWSIRIQFSDNYHICMGIIDLPSVIKVGEIPVHCNAIYILDGSLHDQINNETKNRWRPKQGQEVDVFWMDKQMANENLIVTMIIDMNKQEVEFYYNERFIGKIKMCQSIRVNKANIHPYLAIKSNEDLVTIC